jgi:protease-4
MFLCTVVLVSSVCEASTVVQDVPRILPLSDQSKGNVMNSGGSWISKAFFMLLAVQLIPGAIKVFTTYYDALTVPKTKVGLVTIAGEIREGSRMVYEIKTLLENKDIKALVLKIESPGGAPGTSQAVYDVIKRLSQKHGKPVVAWIENIGASGAYYIAAAANHIICTPSALVGSIGVYMARPYLKDFIEQFKARYIIMRSGKYKAAGSPFKESTPEEDAMFNAMLSEIRERFVMDVLAVRGKQLENTPREFWAEGQPINGDKALELGLVDEIGSQLTVEDRIKELAGITTEIEWVKPAKKSVLAKWLGGDEGDDEHPYISAIVDRFCARLSDQLGICRA